MSHDKLKAAIRARMARTGEPYSVARRAVLNERAAEDGAAERSSSRWFALRYDANGLNGLTAFLDGVFSLGRPTSGVEIDPDQIRVRSPGFEQRIPRASIRAACLWDGNLHGTSGVHVTRGQLLVNGASSGLVRLTLDPPCRTARTMNTMWVRQPVREVVVSLLDPEGFLDALSLTGPDRGEQSDDQSAGK
jgi:hypothetical protein